MLGYHDDRGVSKIFVKRRSKAGADSVIETRRSQTAPCGKPPEDIGKRILHVHCKYLIRGVAVPVEQVYTVVHVSGVSAAIGPFHVAFITVVAKNQASDTGLAKPRTAPGRGMDLPHCTYGQSQEVERELGRKRQPSQQKYRGVKRQAKLGPGFREVPLPVPKAGGNEQPQCPEQRKPRNFHFG